LPWYDVMNEQSFIIAAKFLHVSHSFTISVLPHE